MKQFTSSIVSVFNGLDSLAVVFQFFFVFFSPERADEMETPTVNVGLVEGMYCRHMLALFVVLRSLLLRPFRHSSD